MTSISTNATGLTLELQSRGTQPAQLLSTLNGVQTSSPAKGDTAALEDDAEAREAANKFEAMMLHNMLKSMRKTTLSENQSNERAIYDDMFDERMADTLMEAGGIGVADQILAQIRQQQGTATKASETVSDTDTDLQRLRKLAEHIERPPSSIPLNAAADNVRGTQSTASQATQSLSMVSGLWGNQNETPLTPQQKEFVMPLAPHAQRNAQKLGTTPQAILAIAALETGWGQSLITDKQGNDSHNLFGIKATASDQRYAKTLTTEYLEGSPQKLEARFKKYDSNADAVDGFADFIVANPRYSTALQNASNPEQFLTELQNAGYATDPDYAEKAISIMRQITGNTLPL